MEKHFSRGFLRREYGIQRERWTAHDTAGAERKFWKPARWHPQWVDIDGRGRVIYGEDGCLWAWSGFPDGRISLIADLNGHVFERKSPPDWALRW